MMIIEAALAFGYLCKIGDGSAIVKISSQRKAGVDAVGC